MATPVQRPSRHNNGGSGPGGWVSVTSLSTRGKSKTICLRASSCSVPSWVPRVFGSARCPVALCLSKSPPGASSMAIIGNTLGALPLLSTTSSTAPPLSAPVTARFEAGKRGQTKHQRVPSQLRASAQATCLVANPLACSLIHHFHTHDRQGDPDQFPPFRQQRPCRHTQ